jgi:hypothetical protein
MRCTHWLGANREQRFSNQITGGLIKMKLFVPLIATAAIAVCIGANGIAWSQTTEDSSSQTTTTMPMAPAVTEKTTTVTAPAATRQTTTTTSDSSAVPSSVQEKHARTTTYGPLGDKTVTHDSSSTYNP